MKTKSLRQLAKEIGVSHSYLSQVKHGKRPVSAKMVSNGKQVGNQSVALYDIITNTAELCSGSTGDFGSLSPGSNPGSAATPINGRTSRIRKLNCIVNPGPVVYNWYNGQENHGEQGYG
jgi:hypothetical protein